MTTQRKPKAPTPEADRGGRVYLVEGGKIWEGRKEYGGVLCGGCKYVGRNADWRACAKAEFACNGTKNVRYGHRALHPVQAVG